MARRPTSIGVQIEYIPSQNNFITSVPLQLEYEPTQNVYITSVGIQIEYVGGVTPPVSDLSKYRLRVQVVNM